jgi:hypothetical protein
VKIVPEFKHGDTHVAVTGETAAFLIWKAIVACLTKDNLAIVGVSAPVATHILRAVFDLMLQLSTRHFGLQKFSGDKFRTFVSGCLMAATAGRPRPPIRGPFVEALVALFDFRLLPQDFAGGFAVTTDGGSLHLIATLGRSDTSPNAPVTMIRIARFKNGFFGGADVGNTSVEFGFPPAELQELLRKVARLEAQVVELQKDPAKHEELAQAVQELQNMRAANADSVPQLVRKAGAPKGGRITKGLLESEMRVRERRDAIERRVKVFGQILAPQQTISNLNKQYGKLSSVAFGQEESSLRQRLSLVWLLQRVYNSPQLKRLGRMHEILERRAFMRSTRFVTLEVPFAQYQHPKQYLAKRVRFPAQSPESIARSTVQGTTRGAKSQLRKTIANTLRAAQTEEMKAFLQHARKEGIHIAYDANPGGRGTFPRVALPEFIRRQTMQRHALRHVTFQKQKGTRSSKQDAAILHDLTDCAAVDHLDPSAKPNFDVNRPLPDDFKYRFSPGREIVVGRDQDPIDAMALVEMKVRYGAPHPSFLRVGRRNNNISNNNRHNNKSNQQQHRAATTAVPLRE